MTQLDLNQTRRCLCGNLRATSRTLTQLYDEALKPAGLRTTQFTLLVNIARSGPVAVGQLAETLLMDQTTLTRNLRPLERQGWVARSIGADQRTRLLVLTAPGNEVLGKAYPFWEQVQAQVAERLGQERLKAFLKELVALNTLLV